MLTDQIHNDLKQATLDRNEIKVSTLRLLISEINYAKIHKGQELEDSEVITVVQKELKKRKEAAAGFRQGEREDQAQKEEAEAKVLGAYLPEQISDEELTNIVQEAITEVGASSISDMGKVIGVVMGKVAGKAEGVRVSSIVKNKLE